MSVRLRQVLIYLLVLHYKLRSKSRKVLLVRSKALFILCLTYTSYFIGRLILNKNCSLNNQTTNYLLICKISFYLGSLAFCNKAFLLRIKKKNDINGHRLMVDLSSSKRFVSIRIRLAVL